MQDVNHHLGDGRLVVVPPGLSLLPHRLGLGQPLGPGHLGLGKTPRPDRIGVPGRLGPPPVFLGLGQKLNPLPLGLGRLDHRRQQLLGPAADLALLNLGLKLLLDDGHLQLFGLDGLGDPVPPAEVGWAKWRIFGRAFVHSAHNRPSQGAGPEKVWAGQAPVR